MRPTITAAFILLVLSAGAIGQTYGEDVSSDNPPIKYDLPVPDVRFNDRAVMFQASLYPDFYRTHSVQRDMRWVREQNTALMDFWDTKGDSVLWLLTQYSGLDWVEDEFDLFVLRYYPSFGGADPLVIPIGAMRQGALAVAAPEGSVLQFGVIFQLAHRMLAQAEKADDPFYRALAGHPLMQPTPYRRDNLAMLLALVTAQKVIGLDSTFEAYQSAFWKEHTPGRQVFEQYLLSDWILTPERPLAQWVVDEPPVSRLVDVTRPPRRATSDQAGPVRRYIEGLPMKGQLGFSVAIGDNNRLTVDKIDSTRLAFACGLREADLIRSVDGKRLRTHKQMIEYILEGLDRGGATLSILRNNEDWTVLIRPLDFLIDQSESDYFYPEETADTLFYEPVLPDSLQDTTGNPEPK